MSKRFKMSRSKSRKSFRRGADLTHKANFMAPIMRGGYRL